MFNYELIKNPEFFKDNALPAHSDHVAVPNEQSFFTGENAFRYSLNGLWKFSYGRNLTDCVMGFEADDYDCHNWQDIRVPAHIQMEGHDAPMYVNVQYPWEGHEELSTGEVPEKFNPVASYVKYFSVPAHIKGMPLYISFQGVESGMAVWFNGHYIGYSEDSFTPTEFDLTPYVCDGENKLAVRVFKWTTGSWMEDQDFFRFSGIFRDVYLFTRPATDIYDIHIRTLLDDNYENAELKADLKVSGTGSIKAKLASLPLYAKSSLSPEIVTGNQYVRPVFEGEIALDCDNASTGDICTGNITGHMATYETYTYTLSVKNLDVKLWSAEVPQLYELLLYVYNKEGELTEIVSQLVGFRRFELKNTMMHLNGKRIVFKGVNRHEFSSKTGRVPQEDEILQDVLTMKRHNINAIRTSHYPNDSRIYQLCDRFGLYMIDETNMETHGTWGPYMFGAASYDVVLPGDKPEWEAMMLDRVNSIWQRDKNHPAILIWSCGNESFGGLTIKKMSDLFHKLDNTRLVHYEGIFNDRSYPETSDIESQMYTPAAQIAEFLKEHRDKPFICCEYTHAMGNSCGAMHKYTELTDTEPLYQGGFIWDYVDQSIYKKDRYGQDFQAYGGDFDDRPSDYNFSGNGIVYGGDRTPSPKMQAVKYNYQNIEIIPSEDKVKVINKNLFISTKVFTCTAALNRNGHCIGKFAMNADVAPLSEGEFELPFNRQEIEGEYTVTVSFSLQADTPWADAGYEVAFGQYVYKVEDSENNVTCSKVGTLNGMTITQSFNNVGVRGNDFEVLFSFAEGGMTSYRYGGIEMLKVMPKPNFWRAPIDNDEGSMMPVRYGQWKLASMYCGNRYLGKWPGTDIDAALSKPPVIEAADDHLKITFTWFLRTIPDSSCDITYVVTADGTVEVTMSYEGVEGLPDMPEFGMMMKMDADYDHVEWYGLGPDETYIDRYQGAKLGIYKNLVKDNMARYMVPQECGNKTGVRWAKVTDRRGRGLMFEGNAMHFSALPWTPHEIENARHAYELPPVHYTVIRTAQMQMGVGGDNSWGARTHEEYLLPSNVKRSFAFRIRGI